MSRRKTFAWLLSLTLLCAALLPAGAVHAQPGEGDGDSGMVLSKTAQWNADGSCTIRLEAYATGDKIITEVKKDVPTDIILVLDQSGSMADAIGTVSFTPYPERQSTNAQHYENRHNGGKGNLYYRMADGRYASVSVTLTSHTRYAAVTSRQNNYYYENRNNLYARVGNEYRRVTVSRTNSLGTYTYTLDGTTIATSTGRRGVPDFGAYGPLYLLEIDAAQNEYEYSYTDAAGERHVIGTSTGADTRFETTLYSRSVNNNGGGSRIAALTRALENFTQSVQRKAVGLDGQPGTDDDVGHRIAVVGFASASNYNHQNTELFIGSSQYSYGNSARNQYRSAFQDMRTPAGQGNVAASIAALAAEGGTHPDLGLEMANGIFDANPVGTEEKRNRVVILFTDGSPGDYDFDTSVANRAIGQAGLIKNGGATVYTVGIFAGADATSAGNQDGTTAQKSNWFMQQVSSNDGSVRDPSYYLSAADADTLNDIFERISDQIEEGGSKVELGEETVIRDTIAPAFALPEGADAAHITLETYRCTGEGQWERNGDAMGAAATVEGDKVTVTGFDFAEHYVGTVTQSGAVTYRGNKLVISFAISPRPGFLGGNGVLTNAGAGVYENAAAAEPVLTFDTPAVNVRIPAVTVTAEDRDVYLLDSVSAAELRTGAAATVGGTAISLDPTAENFGLAPWQTEYVDLTAEISPAAGLSDLTGDTAYTLRVTVAPKTDGAGADGTPAQAQTGTATAKLRVFRPELTFRDGTAYYGAAAPTGYKNLAATQWKHGEETADEVSMGDAPELSLTYTPDAAQLDGEGNINTKQDVGVGVTVKRDSQDITEYTSFKHEDCDGECDWPPPAQERKPAFLLHVKTCALTVQKTGGAQGEPYAFDVWRNGGEYTQLTVVGNGSVTLHELPVGEYTVREDGAWSWRYQAVEGTANLNAENPEGTVICNNVLQKDAWLNGYSGVVTNRFGGASE